MASKYWVGGAGTLDGSTTTHISDSDGGAGGATYPATTDDLNITANSGTFPFTITLSVSPTFNALNAAASAANARLLVCSSVVGTARTITAAAVSLTDVDFTDITGAGVASPFTGTRLGNAAGNSGITFTAAANKYYVGNTANWNGTVWALTSGGAAGANNFPLPQDTAIFDNAGTAAASTATVNGAFRLPSIDFSALSNTGVTFATGSNACPFYGDLKLTTAGTFAVSGTGTIIASGRNTQTITSSAVSWTQPVTINSLGGTVVLADNLTLGTTCTLTHTAGILNLNGHTLSTGLFSSSNSNIRSITSGGGGITLTGTGTVWGVTVDTELTLGGALSVTLTDSSATLRIVQHGNGTGTTTQENAPSIAISAGSGAFTQTGSLLKNLDFTGFAGTWTNATPIIYGNLTISTGMTVGAGTDTVTFAATSGSQVITTNGKTLDFPIIVNAPGATVQLADNLTMGSTRTLTHTAGTFDLNTKTLSTGRFATSGSIARALTDAVGGGKIATTDITAATVFNATTTTNLTVTRTNPWTIEIGGNTANIRTVNLGAGKSWPTISFTNTTANGELDIVSSGTNTVIKSLTVSTPPQTIKRTAGTTIGIEDSTTGFPSGNVGNLVTIGSLTAASHTWNKVGGGTISSDYLSISYSTATPGRTWLAGLHSTNGGNNSGWTFSDVFPPRPGFIMFF